MDDSLDDFFAKKDKSNKKKGKKTKTKIVAADLLPASTPTPPNELNDNVDQTVDQLADVRIAEAPTEKKKTKKKRDKDGGDGVSKHDDDEWNEVHDEVDYSGLRIATTNTVKAAAEEAAENAARPEPEYDEDGQIIEKPAGAVWKTNVNPNLSSQEDAPPPRPQPVTPVIAELPNVTGGKYVPPSRRGGAPDLEPVSMVRRPMRKKTAPNVNSQEDFPTLGAAPPPNDIDYSRFERVRGGGSSIPTSGRSDSQRLETSNMYSALERR